jgi:hypothetical protein
MRDLQQHTGAIAGIFFATASPAMIQVLQHRQRLLDDLMGLLPFDIDNESDAAGIVLKSGIIKSLFGR